jgi:uncharacterized protein YbjT (DUF2867 family)
MSRILVIGAHGTVGSALVPLLTADGHEVVGSTSRPIAGPGQVHLDLLTGNGLSQAFEGIDAAFILSPPGHVNQDELLGRLIDAARSRRLEKVVLMSAMGADADPSAPLARAEQHLMTSGLPWNVIRPNWFMQNFNTFWLKGIREQDTIFLPLGSAKGSFIDARDNAAVAAALLPSHAYDGHAFDLTGAEALDHDEVAGHLSRETGRSIRYQDITPEQMLKALLDAGLPRPYAEFLNQILGYFKAGYSERITDSVQRVTGRSPRGFTDYTRDHRAAWLPGPA